MLTRIKFFFIVWFVKAAIALQLKWIHIFHPSPQTQPTFIKSYSCRPSLHVRFFIPQSYTKGSSPCPLYISVHEGAFVTCDASIDDSFCKSWCERTGMVVASINYRKAPRHCFPVPMLDVAAVSRAIIDDASLNIDKTRVVMGGFSAGGTLLLSACQLPELRGLVKAAVTFFPMVDWSTNPDFKWSQRLYTEKPSERLHKAGWALDWAFVPSGQDRKEKLLSPSYASRDELPPYVCMVAAQHDLLCRDVRDMIYSLAGEEVPEKGWDQGWEKGSYKWMLVMGVKHGFTDEFRKRGEKDGVERRRICDETYASIHAWLKEKALR